MSIVAVTGSSDLTGLKYNMVCKAQAPPKSTSKAAEIIQNLDQIVLELVKRCNQSVSYPTPTYYAHFACTRAKIYASNLT